MEYDIWGNEIIPEPPKPKAKRRKAVPERQRKPFWESNDMDAWYRDNMPQTLDECADVRKAMKKREPSGDYSASDYYTKTGRKFLVVKGPVSQFVIVSPAAKRLFSRRLSNRESYINILTAQFEAAEARQLT